MLKIERLVFKIPLIPDQSVKEASFATLDGVEEQKRIPHPKKDEPVVKKKALESFLPRKVDTVPELLELELEDS